MIVLYKAAWKFVFTYLVNDLHIPSILFHDGGKR